jgi:hypothetical protein
MLRQRRAVDDGRGLKPLPPGDQLFHRQRVQCVECIALHAHACKKLLGLIGGDAGRHAGHGRPALRDGAMVQAAPDRHPKQRAHLSRTARLPEDGHVARIAAEPGDVVANPLQAEHDVFEAHVARVAIAVAADLLEIEKPEGVQPVRDAHDDDVARTREAGAVVRF